MQFLENNFLIFGCKEVKSCENMIFSCTSLVSSAFKTALVTSNTIYETQLNCFHKKVNDHWAKSCRHLEIFLQNYSQLLEEELQFSEDGTIADKQSK
jgi:hypothetical protein